MYCLKTRFYKFRHVIFTIQIMAVLFAGRLGAAGLTVELVPVDADKMVYIPTDNVDAGWRSDPNFVDTSWTLCSGGPGGIGYDRDGDYNSDITLDVGGMMRGTSCFVRSIFQLDADLLREFDYLALRIRYDDGFIAYLNGEAIAEANAPANPGRWSHASQAHEAQSFLTFDVSDHLSGLKSGVNVLAIHGLNVSGDSPDFLLAFSLIGRKNYENNFKSDLPIIVLQTQNGRRTATAGDVQADMGVVAQPAGGNTLSGVYNDFHGPVFVRQLKSKFDYNKLNYRFTISGEDASLLGMPAGDVWRLAGAYSDKSLVRDVIMGTIAHKMGRLSGAPRLCHLFVNDDYKGIYVLLEERTRHENRINVSEAGPEDPSGGFILNMTGEHWLPGVASQFPPLFNSEAVVNYQFLYPDAHSITVGQTDYITGFMHDFETAVKSGDMPLVYQRYINLPAFVDYFLLNEIAKDVNAYRNKTTFYKDRDSVNGQLYIEPAFDFEHTLANINYYDGDRIAGWAIDYLTTASDAKADTLLPPFWWDILRKDADFQNHVKLRWDSLYDALFTEDAVINRLDSLYTVLENERDFNFERWNVIGQNIQPNSYVGGSYDDDYGYLYLWLIDRLNWMNSEIAGYPTGVESGGADIVDFKLAQNYPNPFNPVTRINYYLKQSGFVRLAVFNLRGEDVARLVHEQQPAGHYTVSWDASEFPSGVYFYELSVGEQRAMKRMLLLK